MSDSAQNTEKPWYEVSFDELCVESESIPDPHWMSDNVPLWVRHLYRELARTYAPVANLGATLKITPRGLGGMLGHQIAAQKALLALMKSQPPSPRVLAAMLQPADGFPPYFAQALDATDKASADSLNRAFERAILAPSEEGAEFFQAFARGLKSSVRDGERTNTSVSLLLAVSWQKVESFATLPELHKWLCGILTPSVVGSLKRVEKMCQRIGLKLHKRGRPKSPAKRQIFRRSKG